MKNVSVVLLSVVCLAFAGFAEAAKPKKRTRNANRVGAYGVGFLGHTNYTSDHSQNEQDLEDTLVNTGNPYQDLTTDSKESTIGYNATFGYRFNRYFAAELGLAQFGTTDSTVKAQMDFDDGRGFVPVSLKLAFSACGPIVSGIGILPVNDKFEVFGRVGYLFSSSERELTSRVDGERGGFGSAKGDTQDLVLGVGAAYHFSVVYSVRLEYLKIDEVGQDNRSGLEDLSIIGLGVVVRF